MDGSKGRAHIIQKMLKRYCPFLFSIPFIVFSQFSAAQIEEDDEELLDVIELGSFEVFSNSMKIIDGITGKEWEGEHPVVLGFRREFDSLLTKYHKHLLLQENKKLRTQVDCYQPLIDELNGLAQSFGFEGKIEPKQEEPRLSRELSIFRRMVEDPFFNIQELVVWDINGLKIRDNILPKNKYAKNIRLNPETGKWERRVLTKWRVSFLRNNRRRTGNYLHNMEKGQGLNLESNEGFHLIESGLPWDVPPHAFQEVALQYPILVDTAINVDEQVNELSRDFVENLYYIYDPFSWLSRGNTRFTYGFPVETKTLVRSQSINVNHRAWFDTVLGTFFNDVAVLNHWSPDVIYARQMAVASKKNKNQLGEDLDLLNWRKRERRKVDYEPVPNKVPDISFDSGLSARYILLDAYRRYGDRLVDALRKRVIEIDGKISAKQLVREALQEASGIPTDKYIPAAILAQKKELDRFLR